MKVTWCPFLFERISLLKLSCICEKQYASYNHFPLKMKFCINSRKRKLHLFFSFSRIGERKKERKYIWWWEIETGENCLLSWSKAVMYIPTGRLLSQVPIPWTIQSLKSSMIPWFIRKRSSLHVSMIQQFSAVL